MDWLKTLAPTAATLLGGPLAGMAAKFIADKLGASDATVDAVTSVMAGLNETPEGRIRLAEIDAALRTHAIDAGIDLERLAVANAGDVNKTMQAESASEHWPTYSWRPFIGFCYGAEALLAVIIVFISYVGVMFFEVDASVLGYIPAMLGAVAAIMATQTAVLGVASWFRGKMQADPSLPTINKG